VVSSSLLSSSYAWATFLHFVAVGAFLLMHGPSVFVIFRIRTERDPVRLKALLELSALTIGGLHMAMLLLVASGVWLAFLGDWWGSWWVWASLVVLVAMWAIMQLLGSRHYDRLRGAVGARMFYLKKGQAQPPPESFPPLDTLLASRRPFVMLAVGLGGLLLLFALMTFKPA